MSRWAKPGADGTALVHDMLISAMTEADRGIAVYGGAGVGTVLYQEAGGSPGGMSQLLGRRLRIFQRIANAALQIAG